MALLILLLGMAGVGSSVAAQASRPIGAVLARDPNGNGPFTRITDPIDVHPDSVVAASRALIGVRYRWAGSTPERGMDCSGLIKFVLARFGVSLPHSSSMMARLGSSVAHETSEMKPGDLLFFSKPRSSRISHVGIYSGDGRMVHASPGQRRVVEVPVKSLGRSVVLRTVRRLTADQPASALIEGTAGPISQ